MLKTTKLSLALLLSSVFILNGDSADNKVEDVAVGGDVNTVVVNKVEEEESQKFRFEIPLDWLYKYGFITREDVIKIANEMLLKQHETFAKSISDIEQKISQSMVLSKTDHAKLKYLLKQVVSYK